MAAVQCSKCTAERKGFRRELDSWRHKLIHCVGIECILEGIYGPMLLKDLNLFVGCEPEEIDDFSPEASCSQCSFCNISLDKLSDPVSAAMSPRSSPSDLSPCLAPTMCESTQSAHRFLHAVFHKKDVSLDCDSNIPLVAQELMKKMIRKFAVEYASKSLLRTNANGLSRSSSPSLETSDAPLDLTVSRIQEEKKSKAEPADGVLDLSNRNLTSSATLSSSNYEASGFQLPSVKGEPELRGIKFHRSSALDAVLRSLCSVHRSLLYQILKLAQQEKLLPIPNHKQSIQAESHCCVGSPQEAQRPHLVPSNECKVHNHGMFCTAARCECQSLCHALYHAGNSSTGCSIRFHPFRSCNIEGQRGSSYGCVQRCRMEMLCSKRPHCVSCQGLAVNHKNNTASSLGCFPESCCEHDENRCLCHPNLVCLRHVKNPADIGSGGGDQLCHVLQREQSPSPPPRSLNKKTNKKPPSLSHHKQVEEVDPAIKSTSVNDSGVAENDESQGNGVDVSSAEQNPNGALLQHVTNGFGQKLETIKCTHHHHSTSLSSTLCVTEKEGSQRPSTSQSPQCPADTHLTEIITTVLHTGTTCDYSLSEIFDKQDREEPRSPNTRYRRRQDVLVALAAPANDAFARRQSLQSKHELALLDQSYCRKKGPTAKETRPKDGNCSVATVGISLLPDVEKEEPNGETEVGFECAENNKTIKATLRKLSSETVNVTPHLKVKTNEDKLLNSSNPRIEKSDPLSTFDAIQTLVTLNSTPNKLYGLCSEDFTVNANKNHKGTPDTNTSGEDSFCLIKDGEMCQSEQSNGIRRSTRNIVPPQWISSYVTEPRAFFPPNFTDDVINCVEQDSNKVSTQLTLDSFLKEKDVGYAHLHKQLVKEPTQTEQVIVSNTEIKEPNNPSATEETSSENLSSENKTNDHSASDRRLRSSSKKIQVLSLPKTASNVDITETSPGIKRHSSSEIEYISPIKLMFVSPVKDKDGVWYSLKSAGSGSSTQSDHFDPYEESSWLGAPQKRKNHSKKSQASPESVDKQRKSLRSSPVKSTSTAVKSPAKSTCTPTKSSPSPAKATCSPAKSTPSPAKATCSPAKSTPSPAKATCSPAKSTPSPAKATCSPAKSTPSPAKATCSPAKSTPSPAKATCSPAKSSPSPAKATCTLAKSTPSPAKSTRSPAKSTPSPAKLSSTPGKLLIKSTPSPALSKSSPGKSQVKLTPSPPIALSSAGKSHVKFTSELGLSPNKSDSSPAKSNSSPAKSSDMQSSASSSPKSGSRRLSCSTPPKNLPGTGSQLSPEVLVSIHETTPLKRRPGRPKKLGPHFEQKVKRPIGRPRKQKGVDGAADAGTMNGKHPAASDADDGENKNLKITVVYGRSRRNKRMVSEGFGIPQTDVSDALQGVDIKGDFGLLLHHSKKSSGSIKTASEGTSLASPPHEPAPQSSGSIKCVKRDESAPSRKPGRPAKVKISGISVTVTTVSPRQRKIQINKEKQQSPTTHLKRALLPEVKSAKESQTINRDSASQQTPTKEGFERNKHRDEATNPPMAVRHSMRERKPSIHFLHAVATSGFRSYSRSNALVRRSKKLLLTKESNERRQEEQQSSAEMSKEKRKFHGPERKAIPKDLNRVAAVSVDSIFSPKTPLKWWAASAEKNSLNQELARRIRFISDSWVPDTPANCNSKLSLKSKLDRKESSSSSMTHKNPSVVRSLFDCSPNKPRSCSMQQIRSWFMETTETQSLGIVKKASARNRFELMHFPRCTNEKSVCQSPQAERLRKHMKKFAKTVPKSPFQHQKALEQLRKNRIRRQLFSSNAGRRVFKWSCSSFSKYKDTLVRARSRFLTQKERKELQKKRQKKKRQRKVATACSATPYACGRRLRRTTLLTSVKGQFCDSLKSSSKVSSENPTQELVDAQKEQKLCSKAWSPETLKECRVFLRKINSPDNESAEEEWDSCTVTLDDGSPSSYVFARKGRELLGVVKAVKSRGTRSTRQEADPPGAESAQSQNTAPAERRRTRGSAAVESTELPQPPPAKRLRQSRMRGLTGPRWCDFVFEN